MSTIAVNIGEMTECYSDFSEKVRVMIQGQMQPGDRSQCTGYLPLYFNEPHASKHHIYAVMLDDSWNEMVNINVIYGKTDSYKQPRHGFKLRFCNFPTKKCIECSCLTNNEPLWMLELDNSSDTVKLATETFKQLVQFYQESIKKLAIGGTMLKNADVCDLKNYDFGVESLKNLKKLVVFDNLDITQFLQKTQHPLKELIVLKESNTYLADLQQIYKIQEMLYAPFLKLNKEQFLELSTPSFDIHIGELNEEDIFEFIQSWRNGTIREQNANYFCRWNLGDSNFDVQKLAELLGAPNHDFNTVDLDIKHFYDKEKTAVLHRAEESYVMFEAVWDADALENAGEDENQ